MATTVKAKCKRFR